MRAVAIFVVLALSLSTASCSRQDASTARVSTQDEAARTAAAQDSPPDARSSGPSSAAEGAAAALPATGQDTVSATRIPFVAGLTTVRAVSQPGGDYETLRVIESISSERYRMIVSSERRDDSGSEPTEVRVARSVRIEDQHKARSMRLFFNTGDPEEFNGTVPGVSSVVVTDLRRTGKAAITFLDVGAFFGASQIKRSLSGTLARVEPRPVAVPMLVNGRTVKLPAIHARANLSDGSATEEMELYVLDDPDNPILLRSRGPGFSSSLIRIEYPTPSGAAESMELDLAANRPSDVYGIYFSFNRDNIRPQSERVLQEMARMLKKNPEWHLRIDGHTDGVGVDAANLDLSRRRAAAVKDALVKRYGIDAGRLTTGGHGAGSPKDRNDTPEGRAHNRRVELRREAV